MSKDKKNIEEAITKIMLKESQSGLPPKLKQLIDSITKTKFKYYMELLEAMSNCSECGNHIYGKNKICENCGFDQTQYHISLRNDLVDKLAKLLNTTPEEANEFLKNDLGKILSQRRNKTK